MNNLDQLHMVACFYFQNLRTRCRYDRIVEYKEHEDYYTFYGRFVCKKRIVIKKVNILPDGTTL